MREAFFTASFFLKNMDILFWHFTLIIVCIIAGMIFCKPHLGIAMVVITIPFEGLVNLNGIPNYPVEVILGVLILICIFERIMGAELI